MVIRVKSRRNMGYTFGCFFAALAIVLYPIAISPMINSSEYRKSQKQNRASVGIPPEATQPGGMKVWTDPFDRKKN